MPATNRESTAKRKSAGLRDDPRGLSGADVGTAGGCRAHRAEPGAPKGPADGPGLVRCRGGLFYSLHPFSLPPSFLVISAHSPVLLSTPSILYPYILFTPFILFHSLQTDPDSCVGGADFRKASMRPLQGAFRCDLGWSLRKL